MKKNMRTILIGLISGLALCCLLYVLIAFYFKDREAAEPIQSATESEMQDPDVDAVDDKESAEAEENEESSEPKVYTNAEHAAALLASEALVPGNVEQVWRATTPELMNIGQGNYTDGKYWYQAYAQRDTASGELLNKDIIVKYDLATGEVLKTSEQYQLNHANDITYNSKLGYLVVCHNSPVPNGISYIDPDTLELVETFAIDNFIYCIDYNEKTNQYVVGLSGGQTFQILDAEFNPVSDVFQPTKKTSKYVTQGCSSDEDFIYFALYKENVVAVYDWDGTFITVIDAGFMPTIAEPESLSVIDGEIYIGAMSSGHTDLRVYKLSGFVPKTEETAEK